MRTSRRLTRIGLKLVHEHTIQKLTALKAPGLSDRKAGHNSSPPVQVEPGMVFLFSLPPLLYPAALFTSLARFSGRPGSYLNADAFVQQVVAQFSNRILSGSGAKLLTLLYLFVILKTIR